MALSFLEFLPSLSAAVFIHTFSLILQATKAAGFLKIELSCRTLTVVFPQEESFKNMKYTHCPSSKCQLLSDFCLLFVLPVSLGSFKIFYPEFIGFLKKIFIYLDALGLSCSRWAP